MFVFKRFGCFRRRRRIVADLSTKLYEITRSNIFHVSELNDKHICLSQAFMLLWQDWFTGDVDGLWTNSCLLAVAYSCVLLELLAMGKITFETIQVLEEPSVLIKIVEKKFTNYYLDQATFGDILQQQTSKRKATLSKSLLKAAKWKLCARRNCATVALESLEEMKILKRDGECLGLRRQYRTVDLGPHGVLEKEIRTIALKSKPPDCYMRILLTLVTMADSHASKANKLLKRYFTKNEYTDAIARIETLTKEWTPQKARK